MLVMTEKLQRTLDTALGVFVRYGYRRTTMGDLADAIGVSRPALYLQFDGKEVLFAAVIEKFVDDALTRIREGVAKRKTLREKLNFAFEVWVIEPFDLASRSPNAAELVETGDIPLAGLARGRDELVEIIRDLLKDSVGPKIARRNARVLVAASRGLKEAAANTEELRGLFKDLISIVLAQSNGET
jgi:AcrR family transcriptional regulator